MTGQTKELTQERNRQFWLRRKVRRLQRLWVWNKDFKILSGVGSGLKIHLVKPDSSYDLGINELPVQEVLKERLQPGDIFYDIGANVGFFTIIAAKLVSPSGRVYAFEPVRKNAFCLKKNAAHNNFENITIFEKAVSSHTGKTKLLLTHHPGGATLAAETLPPDIKGVAEVELVTIDNLIKQEKILPPTFVKIDVEGVEIDVLQGMTQTINKYRPVILYEIDDADNEIFQKKQERCVRFLSTLGYRLTPLKKSYPKSQWHVGHTLAIPE